MAVSIFKRIGIHLLAIAVVSFIAGSCKTPGEDPFEGTIMYDIQYTNITSDQTVRGLRDHRGATMEMTIKRGQTLKVYRDPSGSILERRFYNDAQSLHSQIITGTDTIYEYHSSQNYLNTLEYTHLPDTVIDDKRLQGVKIVANFKTDPKKKRYTFIYYFDRSLKVDPSDYKNYKEGEWDRIISEKKSILTFYSFEMGYYTMTYKAIVISRHPVDDAVFELPSNLYRKK